MIDVHKKDFVAKILIIGETKVGKSSILTRFTENFFSEHLMPTLGIDYKMKKMNVDGTEIKLQIWDTAGQERYRAITQNFYKGALGLAIVFDLTDEGTFKTIKGWLETIKNYAGDKVVKILLGNKSDLANERTVKEEAINSLIKEVNLPYFETSAKVGENIKEAFEFMAKEIKKQFVFNATESIFSESALMKQQKISLLPKQNSENEKKKKCCE